MEPFRLSDLLSIAGFLTLVRVPLALAFPFFADEPGGALAILAAAALSDVLDGWFARHSGRTTLAGGIVDPIVDKLFVGSVAVTLFLTGRLSLVATLLLGTRDLVELPLFLWLVFNSRAMASRSARLKANAFGKGVTVLQFATVVAALVAGRFVTFFAVLSGVSGAVAGATYWVRLFRRPLGPDDAGPSWGGGKTRERTS